MFARQLLSYVVAIFSLLLVTLAQEYSGGFNSATVKASGMGLSTLGDYIFAVAPRTVVAGLLALEGKKNLQPNLEECARSCFRLEMCNVFNYCDQEFCRAGLDLEPSPVGACELRFQRELAEGLGVYQLATGGQNMGSAGIQVWVDLNEPVPAGYEYFPAHAFFGLAELQCSETLVPGICAVDGSLEEVAAKCNAWSACQGFTYRVLMGEGSNSRPTAFLKGTRDGSLLNPADGRIHPAASSFVKIGQVATMPDPEEVPIGDTPDKHDLTSGEIAGIVLGSVFGGLLIGGLLLALATRYYRRSKTFQQGIVDSSCDSMDGHSKDEEVDVEFQKLSSQTERYASTKNVDCALVAACAGKNMGQCWPASNLQVERIGCPTASLAALLFKNAPKSQLMSTLVEEKTKLVSMMQWQDVLVEPSDIQFCKDKEGKRILMGGGASCSVYRVILHGRAVCACKVYDFGAATSLPDYFVQEARLLRSFNHPNVVRFYGVSVKDGQGLLLMEMMGGKDLAQVMHDVAPDEQGARLYSWYNRGCRVAQEVASGLAYLHQSKIVHMDLKPQNILLAQDGTAKIGDVGFSRLIRGTQVSNSAEDQLENLGWCAPEVLKGDLTSEKADIYSFGVVLAEMITGQQVKQGRMPTIVAPAECPQEVADLQVRCVAQDPDMRPSAAEIVALLGGRGWSSSGEPVVR